MSISGLRHKTDHADFCVVGGGLAGMCAALAAARRGARVALIHDRPVLGGNASSEIRMWIWGARGPNNRETGIIEELLLENRYRNPLRNYSIWDSVLYGEVCQESNLTLLLNCSCNDLQMEGRRIRAVKGWQTTTQTWHTIEADLFADCSGDSILAPLSGAEYRTGREASSEFGESIAPAHADGQTMGMSCLIQARQTDRPQPFVPPHWANVYATDDDLPHRDHDLRNSDPMWNNFWWVELGGDRDSIHDTEEVRDELLKAAFGVWDHIKNRGDHGAGDWALDWVGFLPGKRESRRYVGDCTITENDVRTNGQFEDVVAYGGWPIDDHHPGGMKHLGKPSRLCPVPAPWGIPYRALYSRNVDNLFCAGRNISTTHAAFSSSRVMATCAIVGQAIGTAAAIAARSRLGPRGVYHESISCLQQALLEDDCHLPGKVRDIPALTRTAALTASEGDPEPLRNGVDRPVGETDNGWTASLGSWVQYTFDGCQRVRELRFVFDNDLNRPETTMLCKYLLHSEPVGVPKTITRAFRIEALDGEGNWAVVVRKDNNYQRLVRLPVDIETRAIRLIPETTWGSEVAHLFAWTVK